jgi:DNA-binding GntR family transcriptional regulator
MNAIPASDVGKIKVEPIRVQVYEALKSLILSNRWLPGQTIVVDQLATQMGVSRTPVREALLALEQEGLVEIAHHKVAQVSLITERDVCAVYEVRRLMECYAARIAATSLSDEALAHAEELLDALGQQPSEPQAGAYLQADLYLHNTIAGAVDNPLLNQLFGSVSDQALRIRSLVEGQSLAHEQHITGEHRAIVEALKQRNPDLAEKCMSEHLQKAMKRTLQALHRTGPAVAAM